MLKWFDGGEWFDAEFKAFAIKIIANVQSGPERTVALRKLLESRDAIERATMIPGG
jgi:hypothetical protein